MSTVRNTSGVRGRAVGSGRAASSAPHRRSRFSDRPAWLLLVEDNPGYRAGLESLFAESRPDLEVIGAGSAREALDWLRVRQPGLVLMDVRLPDVNGLELTGHIKALYGGSPPVVILTSYDIPEYRQAAQERGADGYLCKQLVSPSELLALVERFIPAP